MAAVGRRVDMHMHSRYSDGSDSIGELAQKVEAAGIGVFSLTDHDTADGNCIRELVPDSVLFFNGIELSCKSSVRKCHILGYDFDEQNKDLREIIEEGRKLRKLKFVRRISYLKEVHHIEFDPGTMEYLRSLPGVGKPHIAKALVDAGYGETITEAITTYLNGCRTGSTRVDAEKAVRAIRSAGGIAVWAHPLGGEGERHLTEREFDEALKVLLEYGIQGLECYYSRYNQEEIAFLLRKAAEHHLYVSAGSDYHGTVKNIAIGEVNTFGRAVYEEELSLVGELRRRTKAEKVRGNTHDI